MEMIESVFNEELQNKLLERGVFAFRKIKAMLIDEEIDAGYIDYVLYHYSMSDDPRVGGAIHNGIVFKTFWLMYQKKKNQQPTQHTATLNRPLTEEEQRAMDGMLKYGLSEVQAVFILKNVKVVDIFKTTYKIQVYYTDNKDCNIGEYGFNLFKKTYLLRV